MKRAIPSALFFFEAAEQERATTLNRCPFFLEVTGSRGLLCSLTGNSPK